MDTFEKARAFMYRNARPLDLARFQYHFEGGSRENVLRVLGYYQNEDGGFGHAVEADCWNPNSTPLHSSSAGEIIREIGLEDRSHPLIRGLINYYTSGKDFDGKHWAITVESNNIYPHAPWWNMDSADGCHTDYNGTAQIAGFLIFYGERDSKAFRLGIRVANEALRALLSDDLDDMHTCASYIRMMEYIEKADAKEFVDYDALNHGLHRAVKNLITSDKTQWGAYVCKPSNFFRSRDSEFYAENKEMADYECEFIKSTQHKDGSWDIPWSWADYPQEWAIAKRWWKGNNIVQNLLYLKGMGRS